MANMHPQFTDSARSWSLSEGSLAPGSEVFHRGSGAHLFPSFLILDIKGTESEASSRSTGCDEGVRSIALRAWTRCSGRSVNLRPSVKSQQVDVVPLPMSRFAESPSEDDAGVEIAWVVPLVELVPLGMLAWSESGIEDNAVEVNPGMFSLMRLVSPGMLCLDDSGAEEDDAISSCM